MKKLIIGLATLLAVVALTLVAAPAQAVGWNTKTCTDHPDKSYTTCMRSYTTVWNGTYTVHYVETCLSGLGATGGLVRNARDNRVVITTAYGVTIGAMYTPNVDRGDCVVSEINPPYWPSGDSAIETVWKGHVNVAFPGFDDDFKMCRKSVNGLSCLG